MTGNGADPGYHSATKERAFITREPLYAVQLAQSRLSNEERACCASPACRKGASDVRRLCRDIRQLACCPKEHSVRRERLLIATQTETTSQRKLPQGYENRLYSYPAYVDMIYPEVGIATLQLLERFGLDVGYPRSTCCGQPLSNSGDERNSQATENFFVENFKDFDCIVGPQEAA